MGGREKPLFNFLIQISCHMCSDFSLSLSFPFLKTQSSLELEDTKANSLNKIKGFYIRGQEM